MAFFGITAKNSEQKAAMQALINNKPFTFLTGPAGSGKTLVAQAVGLERTIETRSFRKLIYTRLQTQVGMDVGALPGDLNEKTYPFIAPFMDNLEVMSAKSNEIRRYLTEGDDDKRKVFFDSIQTIRGRSLNYTYVMFDEIQNVDIHTMAALATRPGMTAKFVFLGNFSQIDTPKLRNTKTNGLYRLLNGLYERQAFEYFDHVNLTETQRHPVVEVVEDILRNHEMAPEFEALEARGNVAE
ncbi:PhoH family protein [Heyndrickxia sporothermodurans]|uniref:PhoH family protein n=1 Tax=Heyndrickxia sporothermodurans TaxID=46224 RepID=UPI002E1AAB9A|nr:PhoH family protein [Heyndrickxia sporothermodurans]MED3649976.1 PhoH family protein [Heyndrickxia sporothermodurans]MED3697962.1 PhoH family protein [Heyndrickxia sporothermodurans]